MHMHMAGLSTLRGQLRSMRPALPTPHGPAITQAGPWCHHFPLSVTLSVIIGHSAIGQWFAELMVSLRAVRVRLRHRRQQQASGCWMRARQRRCPRKQ